MSNLHHGMKLRSFGWRLSCAAVIVLVVGTSVVSCKTRCFDGRKYSGTSPLDMDRDQLQALLLKLFPSVPQTFLDNWLRTLDLEFKDRNELARRFNESADRACLARRCARWLDLTYPRRIFGMGVTKGLTITDGTVMTPKEYLVHDFGHADRAARSSGPRVLLDAINESASLVN